MRRIGAAAIFGAALVWALAGCATRPPLGTGGAAETSGADAWPPPAYWTGAPIHPDLRAEALAASPGPRDARVAALGDDWVRGRLEIMSCLDFRLEGLGMAGASDLFPAEVALARADRRRALRALMGGLPRDGELDLRSYRDRVGRIEDGLLRAGRPVDADVRNLRC